MAQESKIGPMVALVALGIAIGGAGVYMLVSRPAPPPPAPSPAPTPVAVAPGPIEAAPPAPEPSPATTPESSPETAAAPPTEKPARPVRTPAAGKATAAAPAGAETEAPNAPVATRSFSAGASSAQGPMMKGAIPGFSGAKGDVHRAPRVPGTIEFETDPAAPVPGQPYVVRVFLQNQGKKTINLQTVAVTVVEDGVQSGGAVPLTVKEIKAGQRVMVAERRETWPARPAQTFALQATVKSKDDDTYARTLTLK